MIWSGLELSRITGEGALPRRGSRDRAGRGGESVRPGRRLRRPPGRERHRRAARRGNVRTGYRGRRLVRAIVDPDECRRCPVGQDRRRLLRPVLRRPCSDAPWSRPGRRTAGSRSRSPPPRSTPAARRRAAAPGRPFGASLGRVGPSGRITFRGSGSRSSGRSARAAARRATRGCSSTGARPSTAPASGRTSRARDSESPARSCSRGGGRSRGSTPSRSPPGVTNGKEGGSFLHVRAYLVRA